MESILDQIRSLAAKSSQAERQQMLTALRVVSGEVAGTPVERLIARYDTNVESAAMIVAYRLNVFELLLKTGTPMTTKMLAESTGADMEFLDRILRYLAAASIIKETGEQTWMANETTQEFQETSFPRQSQLITWCGPSILGLPRWLETNGYKSPVSGKDCPWTLGAGNGVPQFEYFGKNPKEAAEFNWCMESFSEFYKTELCEVYPLKKQILKLEANKVAFVDVGGGNGHVAEAIRAEVYGPHGKEEQKGKFVVQDLDFQIKNIKDAGIDKQRPFLSFQVGNFFEEQKLRNAKFYYFRHVFHDHPDASCQEILTNMREAMDRDSVMLIHDLVIPTVGVGIMESAVDLLLMSSVAGKERTEAEWHALINAVGGLKVKKISTYGDQNMGLVEVVRDI